MSEASKSLLPAIVYLKLAKASRIEAIGTDCYKRRNLSPHSEVCLGAVKDVEPAS